VANEAGVIVVAESVVLEARVFRSPPDFPFGDYLRAIAEVHGWAAIKTPWGYQIKAPDLAAPYIVPRSAVGADGLQGVVGEEWPAARTEDYYVVRAPQGSFLPPVAEASGITYRVSVVQVDALELADLGISINVLAEVQKSQFSLLSQFTFAEVLKSGAAEASGVSALGIGAAVGLAKSAGTISGSWYVVLEGNTVEPAIWSEQQTRNIYLESRNVNDSRVAVDREQIQAGKRIEILPVGNGFFRFRIEDLSIVEDDVRGLSAIGVVDLRGRKASWIYGGSIETKQRGLFRRKTERREISYLVTAEVLQREPGVAVAEVVESTAISLRGARGPGQSDLTGVQKKLRPSWFGKDVRGPANGLRR